MRTTIHIPCFPGFYGTRFEELYVIEQEQDRMRCEYPQLEYLDEWCLPKNYRKRVAEEFAEKYIDELNFELGLEIDLVLVRIDSPKEYNFENDWLICEVEIGNWNEFIKKISRLMSHPVYRQPLARMIWSKHTSHDGFISSMSNELELWFQLIQDTDSWIYLSCALWYLFYLKKYGEDDCEQWWDIADRVEDYLVANTDVMYISPTTKRAKQEYEAWLVEDSCCTISN